MRNVFVAYHPNDQRFASLLIDRVKNQARLDTWFFTRPQRRGDWRAEIEQAVSSSLALIVVITPDAHRSEAVIHAWTVAVEMRKPVIPILLKKTPLNSAAGRIDVVDFTGRYRWDALLMRLKDVVLTHLLKDLYEERVAIRKSAAQSLGALRDVRAVPNLLDMLRDGSEQVRGAAAWALGQIQDERAVQHLLKALHDPDSMVRVVAADALAEIGSAEVVPGLLEALIDEDKRVRRAAADALGWLGDPCAVPALVEALRDPAQEVREAAQQALWELGTPAALAALESPKEEARSEKDPS